MPRITVLMPVYNGMPFIPEAVESVLAQDEQDWELVISDNGSTDGTRAYLDTVKDPRICIHLQKDNLGIFGNMNFLLRQARSPIAKILCADDKLLPSALTHVAQFMEDRPYCAISRCWRLGDSEASKRDERYATESQLPVSLNPTSALLAYLTFGNPVGNLSQASCRPRMIIKCGGFDQRFPYSGDREAWARVAARYGLELQNEELVFERTHPLQNRFLLDRQNENFTQTKRIIENWAVMADPKDLDLLKSHWTLHFLAQRVPRLARQVMVGRLKLAYNGLVELPLGISPLSVLTSYLIQKINHNASRITTQKLLARIIELNGGQS